MTDPGFFDGLWPHQKYKLADGALALLAQVLATPGGREMIEAEKENMRREAHEKGAKT